MKKPKFPKTEKQFYVPIYGGTVFLLRSEKAFNKALVYFGIEANNDIAGGRCAMFTSSKGRVMYLVGWFTQRPSTLVHECGHLALFILQRAGIDPSDSNGEAYCYLLEELVTYFGIDKKPKK